MASLQVEVVSASSVVWEGEASSIIARTEEGDMGIHPGHVPVLALLVPSGVEIYSSSGDREVVAVGSGFISVDRDRVTILGEYAQLSREISLDAAERELADAERRLDDADPDDGELRKIYDHALAQVKAAQKTQ